MRLSAVTHARLPRLVSPQLTPKPSAAGSPAKVHPPHQISTTHLTWRWAQNPNWKIYNHFLNPICCSLTKHNLWNRAMQVGGGKGGIPAHLTLQPSTWKTASPVGFHDTSHKRQSFFSIDEKWVLSYVWYWVTGRKEERERKRPDWEGTEWGLCSSKGGPSFSQACSERLHENPQKRNNVHKSPFCHWHPLRAESLHVHPLHSAVSWWVHTHGWREKAGVSYRNPRAPYLVVGK